MMRLRLTVTNSANHFAEHVDAWEFTEAGGTIGRSSSNDWVLPDPKKILSGHHAEIRHLDGGFVIVDIGTNGVFLNGAEFRIGRGAAAPLRNGDRFRIGDYEVRAELETERLTPWPAAERPGPDQPFIPESFIAKLGYAEADRVPDSHGCVADLGRVLEPPSAAMPPREWTPEPLADQAGQWFAQSLAERAAARVPERSADRLPDSFLREPPERDPHRPTDRPQEQGAERPGEPAPESPADLMQERLPGPHAPAEPDPDPDAPPTNPTLPWDLGCNLGGAEVAAAAPRPAPAPGQGAHGGAAAPCETSRGAAPYRHQEPPRDPRPAPAKAPAPQRRTEVAAAPAAHPASAGTTGATPAGGLDAALSCLLAGAGVPDLRVPGGATPEFFHTIGTIIGLYAAGSAELMGAISEIKNTFHIQHTVVRNMDNNPLRWAAPGQAAKRLLAPDGDGCDLSPTAAVADAMDRVMAHQMGVLKGMEAAFKAFVRSLAPEDLERRFEAQGGRSMFTSKRAWYWEQYGKHYARLAEDAGESYLDLLGYTYAEAYEKHVQAIRDKAAAERAAARRG